MISPYPKDKKKRAGEAATFRRIIVLFLIRGEKGSGESFI